MGDKIARQRTQDVAKFVIRHSLHAGTVATVPCFQKLADSRNQIHQFGDRLARNDAVLFASHEDVIDNPLVGFRILDQPIPQLLS